MSSQGTVVQFSMNDARGTIQAGGPTGNVFFRFADCDGNVRQRLQMGAIPFQVTFDVIFQNGLWVAVNVHLL